MLLCHSCMSYSACANSKQGGLLTHFLTLHFDCRHRRIDMIAFGVNAFIVGLLPTTLHACRESAIYLYVRVGNQSAELVVWCFGIQLQFALRTAECRASTSECRGKFVSQNSASVLSRGPEWFTCGERSRERAGKYKTHNMRNDTK